MQNSKGGSRKSHFRVGKIKNNYNNMNDLENLKERTRAEQVNVLVSLILKESGCVDESKTMLGKDVFGKYKERCSKDKSMVNIPENTFSATLSVLSQQPSSVSCIKSAEGKRGYYVDLNLNVDDADIKIKTCDAKIKESDLYESIGFWLGTKVSVVKDIANKRKGEKWQNVDILGLSTYNYCGTQCIDVYSVEVKLNMGNWRQDLFEAVSHSMFANYSYFAFMIKASDVEKIDENLKMYAHKFNIGLLAVAINDKKWEKVKQCSEKISLEGRKANARIIEISIAPEHQVSKRLQNDFLENVLKIKNVDDVYKLSQK